MSNLEIPNGSILPVFPGRLTLTALSITAPMRFDAWEEMLQRILVMNECSAWWLGDALIYGEASYGEMYTQAVEVTGKRYQTLTNYVFVCRAIPPSERRDDLTFSHHAEVAGIKDRAERAEWLQRAADEDWSVAALRRARQEARETTEPAPPSPAESGFQKLSAMAIVGAIAIADEETKQKIRDAITPEMLFPKYATAYFSEIKNGENDPYSDPDIDPFSDPADGEDLVVDCGLEGCVMVGYHFRSECHTAADLEAQDRQHIICELLAVCEQTVAYLERVSSDADTYHAEVMEPLRTAIARAKGEVQG